VFLGVPSTQKYPGTTYYPGQCVPHLFMFTCVRAVREGLNRMYPGTGSVHWHVCMYGHLYTVFLEGKKFTHFKGFPSKNSRPAAFTRYIMWNVEQIKNKSIHVYTHVYT
jgi:hypothetical protein